MTANARIWPLVLILTIFSAPLVVMYFYQVVDSVAQPDPGSLVPGALDLSNWRFLWERIDSGRPSIWVVTFNTFLFASTTAFLVTSLSTMAGVHCS